MHKYGKDAQDAQTSPDEVGFRFYEKRSFIQKISPRTWSHCAIYKQIFTGSDSPGYHLLTKNDF